MKKKMGILVILISFIALNLINIFVLVWFYSSELSRLTGEADRMGMVLLVIEEWRKINISSPENKTYNFTFGVNYTLNLNVSANFQADSWWYTLKDKQHDLVVAQNVSFSPNTTFNAVAWENELIVFANDSSGNTVNGSVEFFVNVPSSAPNIHYIHPDIFVCEGEYLSYYFNVTDLDEQIPTPSINPTSPSSPFYTVYARTINLTVRAYEIFSGIIDKNDLGQANIGSKTFLENVSVNDGQYADSRQTNITIIEINNAPVVNGIGVQTIWGRGENRTFFNELYAEDAESGKISDLNLTLQRVILNSSGSLAYIFNITPLGIINFTANENQTGVYRVWIFVYDDGLRNYHANLTDYCNQTPTNKSSMINFSITVTDENRPPYITSYYPLNLSLISYEGEDIYFNVTMYDPDLTPLDSYWYFDDSLIRYESGFDNGTFSENTYRLSYSSAGNQTIRVNVTDGNLTYSYDSVVWNISIIDVPLPSTSSSGGGGGGKVGFLCVEKWGCSQWNECKNAKDALDRRALSREQYSIVEESCNRSSWKDIYCGFQIRTCKDAHECNSTEEKPYEIQACYYTESPNCEDGIKNCHDESCEILVDCGGPCKPCSTCSDELQNQGEEGIDCGGPCKPCQVEKPVIKTPFRYFMIVLTILLLLIIIIISLKHLKRDNKFNEPGKIRKV